VPGYSIQTVIGSGGFGVVFQAQRVGDCIPLALKVVRSDRSGDAHRLLSEIRALRLVGPPHVPAVVEDGTLPNGCPFVAMEYVPWPTLAERLERSRGPLSADEIRDYGAGILDALEAVHRRNLVHRDLKPENVFVSSQMAKLVDFGLVKLHDADVTERTAAGTVLGTAEYMAPEQCEGDSNIGPAADIYALGVILFEMITGRVPFFGNATEVRLAHRDRRPPRPTEFASISPDLEQLVLSCLAKQPSQRPRDARALKAALQDATRDGGTRHPANVTSIGDGAANAPTTQTQRMAVLCFQSERDVVLLAETVQSRGGHLTSVSNDQFVAVFGVEAGTNPVECALATGNALLGADACSRILVDLTNVRTLRRADGRVRFVSPAIPDAESLRGPGAPRVLLTASAAEALGGGKTAAVDGTKGLFKPDTPGTLAQLGATPLIGRQPVLRSLLDGARTAIADGKPTIATVTADGGHGKSHLAAVLVKKLRSMNPRPQIIQLRARDGIGSDGQETLRALIREVFELPTAQRPPEPCPVSSLVAVALGWISPDDPAIADVAHAPGMLRAQLAQELGQALRARAAKAPLCVLVDDGHYADQTLLDTLEYAALAEAAAPIWICVLARPCFAQGRPFFGDRASRHQAIALQPLADEDAAALCRRLLFPAEHVPTDAIGRLVARAQGIPLLLVELVRGIKRDGGVRRHAQGQEWFVATDELDHLPDLPLVEWLAQREMDSLPPELAAHARLAAVLQFEFTPEEMSGVLGELERAGYGSEFPLDARSALRRLLERNVLVERRDGRLSFRHALVCDAIVRSIPTPLRTRIHAAAFRYYENAGTIDEAARLPRKAHHAAHAGSLEEAARLFLNLADGARSRHAYLDAESRYGRVIELTADPHLLWAARRGRGMMRYRIGRYEDALSDLRRARALAEQLGDPATLADTLLDEATALEFMDGSHEARALVEQARKVAGPCSPLLQARILLGLGRSSWREGFWPEARAMLEQATAEAERIGDEGYETLVNGLIMLASLMCHVSHPRDAQRLFDRVIALCHERGDRRHLAAALNNRYELWFAIGDAESALRDLREYMMIGRQLGENRIEYFGEINLGELYFLLGDLRSAWSHVKRALEISARRADENSILLTLLILKLRMLVFERRNDEARDTLRDIEQRRTRARDAGKGELLSMAEQLVCRMADIALRDAEDYEWDELKRSSREYSSLQERIEFLEIEARSTLGRGGRRNATRLLEEALSLACRVPEAPHLLCGRVSQFLTLVDEREEGVRAAVAGA
jgi:tetratricopeptide (TPR) repeat protein